LTARPALAMSSAPAKRGGSIWLALFLLAVIAAAGYKVWPPLRELWLRTQPPPVATAPAEPTSEIAAPAAAPAAVYLPPAPAAPAEPVTPPAAATPPAVDATTPPVAVTPAASNTTLEAKPPVNSTPARATVAARPPTARPSVSPAAAEWRQLIARALGESGMGDKVRIVAAGNTLTLAGKLSTRSHRYLLELLQGTPADIQIVDHIEFAEEPAEAAPPSSPPSAAIPLEPQLPDLQPGESQP
jgi:hypothetical protein